MNEVDFRNVGFIYKFWYKVFMGIENMMPFTLLRKFIKAYFPRKLKNLSDKWVLGHMVLSFVIMLSLYYLSLGKVAYCFVFYAFVRILEVVVYQLNVLLFHPYKALVIDKLPCYKIQNPYRSVVLLGHNFVEVIFWFTGVSIFFDKPDSRLLYELMSNTVRIFTFDYATAPNSAQGLQLIFFAEVICGILLTIISLAKFLGELPHVHVQLVGGKSKRKGK